MVREKVCPLHTRNLMDRIVTEYISMYVVEVEDATEAMERIQKQEREALVKQSARISSNIIISIRKLLVCC